MAREEREDKKTAEKTIQQEQQARSLINAVKVAMQRVLWHAMTFNLRTEIVLDGLIYIKG